MKEINSHNEFKTKVLLGVEKAFEKLLEFKKQKNSPLVIQRDNKILKIMPEDFVELS